MRISLPPRPGGAGGKSADAGAMTALPPAAKPTASGLPPAGKPGLAASGSPAVSKASSGTGIAKPAVAAPAGVRTVVDTDSGGTALAIAALVASLISFGVVLMSFLAK